MHKFNYPLSGTSFFTFRDEHSVVERKKGLCSVSEAGFNPRDLTGIFLQAELRENSRNRPVMTTRSTSPGRS
jgi:hypothetical protein